MISSSSGPSILGVVRVIANLISSVLDSVRGIMVAPDQERLIPSDTVNVSGKTSKGLLVDTAGRLLTASMSGTVIDRQVVAGYYIPWQVSRVMAVTTAKVIGMF
jgi:hypothetical protein